jgi:hypothetical protein
MTGHLHSDFRMHSSSFLKWLVDQLHHVAKANRYHPSSLDSLSRKLELSIKGDGRVTSNSPSDCQRKHGVQYPSPSCHDGVPGRAALLICGIRIENETSREQPGGLVTYRDSCVEQARCACPDVGLSRFKDASSHLPEPITVSIIALINSHLSVMFSDG